MELAYFKYEFRSLVKISLEKNKFMQAGIRTGVSVGPCTFIFLASDLVLCLVQAALKVSWGLPWWTIG